MRNNRKLFSISFTTLLAEIIQWYTLPQPLYKQYYKKKQQKYKTTVQITTNKGVEIKLGSKLCKNMAKATQSAAEKAVRKLQENFNFDVADINYTTCMHQRKKRRIAEIKLTREEMNFIDLKRYYFQECAENRSLKEQLVKLLNRDNKGSG
ncbi:hypothetical protein SOVF_039160 [Spinacia oleracea]|nr:hypothetical protein SOVF_039160 [Spinacia oleracea]